MKAKCPYCNYSIDKKSDSIACPMCSTLIKFDKQGNITDYEVAGYHIWMIIVLSIISFVLFVIILIDALFSDNTSDKLILIGAIFISILVGYLLIPINNGLGLSRRYSRLPMMLALTLVLFLLLILNINNLIRY